MLSTLPIAVTGVSSGCKVVLHSVICLVVCGCAAVIVVVVVVVEMVFLFGAVVGFILGFIVHDLLLIILVTGKCRNDIVIRI